MDPPDVVFERFPLDFHRFHARPAQERGDRDALPPQTPGVGREAAEQGRRRSYGLAVSILGRLSPLSPCFCSLSCRSCSCCSCRSLCSRLTCIACTLSGLSRFPFHDSQVSVLGGFFDFFRTSRLSEKMQPFYTKTQILASNINLAIMEREARETRERASNASKARAERAARTARAGARRQRTAAWREWREPPEDRDSNPVRSLMPLRGRCAACAGRFELGASRSPLS